MKKNAFLMVLLSVLIWADTSHGAVSVSGVAFEKEVRIDGAYLRARGAGLLKFARLFDVYAGVLYLPPGISPEEALDDIPKRLEVQYFRGFEGEDFGKAAIEYIRRNVSDEKFQRIKPRIDAHNALYVDVSRGDRYALTYIPGRGTELSYNGKPLGTVEGADFAKAIFSVWLGTDPISREFKEALLGL